MFKGLRFFKDLLAFCEHFILPRDLVKMRNKLKRIQVRLYNVRRLSCMYQRALYMPKMIFTLILLARFRIG